MVRASVVRENVDGGEKRRREVGICAVQGLCV